MPIAAGFRSLDFLDGTSLVVPEETCRGCLMNELEGRMPDLLNPVFDDGLITVRQDAEWAVPGFMVIGLRPHLGAIDQLPLEVVHRIGTITYFVRRAMREALGPIAVQMYQEEKLDRPHFHIWMLPLWPEVMHDHGINPRIYESNIAEYLGIFNIVEHRFAVSNAADRLAERLHDLPGQLGPPAPAIGDEREPRCG